MTGFFHVQLDTAKKAKSRLEKERATMTGEVGDLSSSLEDIQKAKANTDKRLRSVEEQLSEATNKVNEYERTLSALQSAQSKAVSENSELSTQLAEAESKLGTLSKERSALLAQVDDLQSELQSETTVITCTYYTISLFHKPYYIPSDLCTHLTCLA